MYKVIGSDGQEQQADLATLKRWAKEGKISRDTLLIDVATNGCLIAGECGQIAALLASAETRVTRGDDPSQGGGPKG